MDWKNLDPHEHSDVIAMVQSRASRQGCTPAQLWLKLHKMLSRTDQFAHLPKLALSQKVIQLLREILQNMPLNDQVVDAAISKIVAEEDVPWQLLIPKGVSVEDDGSYVVCIEGPKRSYELKYENKTDYFQLVRYSFTPAAPA